MRQKRQVKSVILETIKKQKMLSAGILTAVIGAVVAALIPPLILAKIIDTVTAGNEAAFSVILLYFVLLALTGILEAAREGLLTVFGQKITHALRSSLMDKFVSLTIPGRASLLQAVTLKVLTARSQDLAESMQSSRFMQPIQKQPLILLGISLQQHLQTVMSLQMEPTLQNSIPTAACFM